MYLAFGTYDTAKHPRFGVILDGLRAEGNEVEELNHPLGFSTAERVRMLQQPWRLVHFGLRLLRCWWQLVIGSRRFRRDRYPEVVLVGYMGHFDVFVARLLFRRSTVVLDHLLFAGDTASDRGARGLRVRALQALDRAALGRADIAVVDTEEHRQMLPDAERGVVVPVGARAPWFDAAHTVSAEPSPVLRVVFFGLFTPLQGTTVVAEALKLLLERNVGLEATLVGSGQDAAAVHRELDQHPHVTWKSWVEPDALPELVAGHDVCLGIFGTGPKALRVVPNKVYQGLAAGCIVVTSDTPPQRRLVGDHAELVPPGDPHALANRLEELIEPEVRRRALVRARGGSSRFEAQNVVQPLVQRLAPAPSTSGDR